MKRRWGIELEFASTYSLSALAKALRGVGLPVSVKDGGNSDGRRWELKPDPSVVSPGERSEGWNGYELASPALSGRKGLERLQRYMAALSGLPSDACRVSTNAGMHVHYEVKDYEWKNLARLVWLTIQHEELIFNSLPSHRRGNGYCRGIAHNPQYKKMALMLGGTLAEQVAGIVGELTVNRLEDRYCALNLTDYTRRRTVEFRYGAGTLEYSKAFDWLRKMVALVEAAKDALETGNNVLDYPDLYAARAGLETETTVCSDS